MERVSMINKRPVEFKVVEEQRVVIATLYGCELDAVDFFDEKSGFALVPFSWRKSEMVAMPCSLKAVARCHSNDDFDPELGKKIAYRRLRKKYWEKYSDRLSKLSMIMQSAVNACNAEALRAVSIAADIDPTFDVTGGDAE